MKRSEDKIYLSVVRYGDKFKVIDQYGRSVYGIREVEVIASCDDATIATVTFLDSPMGSEFHAYVGVEEDASKKQQP